MSVNHPPQSGANLEPSGSVFAYPWVYAYENWDTPVYGDGGPDGPIPYPAKGCHQTWREAFDHAFEIASKRGVRVDVRKDRDWREWRVGGAR